ncbi:MAG: outer membrane beta-barrel protein [Alphaproteobacteria bacterium]|nr:outer membrane beta-barrel protein [Alphaproteobacteria bacterium]
MRVPGCFGFSRWLWLTLVLGSTSLCTLTGFSDPASAADLAVKAPFAQPGMLWTGFYIGSHVGALAGADSWEQGGTLVASLPATPFPGRSGNGGGIAGAQIGYNYQTGSFVIGVEGDAGFGVVNGVSSCGNGLFACATGIRDMVTLTGRLGYATGDLLFYGKAGAAWGAVEHTMSSGSLSNVFSGSQTRSGWIAGMGVEYAFSPAWSAKIEYGYVDLGSARQAMTDQSAQSADVAIGQNAHMVRLGLNYHLGSPPPGGRALPIVASAVPQVNWSGIYIGAHAGGAFGASAWRSVTGAGGLASSGADFPGSGNAERLFGGAQIGVDHQFGSWVAGLEVAVSAADVDSYGKCATSDLLSYTCHDRVTSIGMVAGRLGQSFGNLLVY